ncbi:MAG: TonB family protein [Elusimicrobiota bacterium]
MNIPVELVFFNQPEAMSPEMPLEPPAVIKKKDEDIRIPDRKKPAKKQNKAEMKPATVQQTHAQPVAFPAQFKPSSQITLESARFPFTYYSKGIEKNVRRNWSWSSEFERLKAVIYFKIMRDGSVANIQLKESSGDSLYDQQALRAVKLCDPFPPLPEAYGDDYLGVNIEFAFRN